MPWNRLQRIYTGWMLAAILAAGITGCRKGVASTDIPGTWKMSSSAQAQFPSDFDITSPTIVFKHDDTFTATGLPQEVVNFKAGGKDATAKINGTGRWVLSTNQNGFSNSFTLMLEFKTIQGPGKYAVPYSTMLFSAEKTDAGIRIYYFHDDPDLGRRIDFEKQEVSRQ